jgi:transposase
MLERYLLVVSSPEEFHPEALAEPDVRLAPHPAPVTQPRAEQYARKTRGRDHDIDPLCTTERARSAGLPEERADALADTPCRRHHATASSSLDADHRLIVQRLPRQDAFAECLHSKGAFWFANYEGGLTGELLVELPKKLMFNRKREVHLIVDGLPAHKKAIVKDYVASTQGRLTSHFLAGYAPDLIPDELVSSHVKRTGVGDPASKGREAGLENSRAAFTIGRDPCLVRSFFGHQSVP